MTNPNTPSQPGRRRFFKEGLAIVIGGIVGLVPALAGLAVFLDPLRRKSKSAALVKVSTLSALPDDGVPRRFSIVISYGDAWNRFPPTPRGAIYLRRLDGKVTAFNVSCPHLGCPVVLVDPVNGYHCPCHDSHFGVDGRISDPGSPSPRGMDELEVQIRNGSEIWVKFQQFRAGVAEKIPV